MNKLNFLVSRFEEIDLSESIGEGVLFSLSIQNSTDIENINWQYLHTTEVYRKKQFGFSLYFNLVKNEQFNESLSISVLENWNLFAQLIFHPNFKRSANKPVIFISLPAGNDGAGNKFIGAFESSMVLQGFKGIAWIQFSDTNPDLFFNEIHRFKEPVNFETFYYSLLKEKFYTASYIGIINESKKTVKDISNLKLIAEKKFEKDFSQQYHILQKYDFFHAEIPVLREKLEKAVEELGNQKKYLHLIREEDEANKINNFYYHEYEVLPSWYKKIGHVLKVLNGKRSFRSLFDNNVKKYKD